MSAAMTDLQLEFGGIYQHASDNSDERPLFKITERWAPDMFVGQHYNEKFGIVKAQPKWMFNRSGHAMGFEGNYGGPLNWSLKAYNSKTYEVHLIFDDNSSTGWEPVGRGSPWTYDTLYVVRETDKSDTARLMQHEEFCSFVDDLEEQN